MATIADLIRAKPNQYDAAIACFVHRDLDREARTITFYFADGSRLKFNISYTLANEEDKSNGA